MEMFLFLLLPGSRGTPPFLPGKVPFPDPGIQVPLPLSPPSSSQEKIGPTHFILRRKCWPS